MLSLDLINVGADAVLILIIATSYRMSLIKQAKLEEKLSKMLSRSETKELIDEEIAFHVGVIKCEIKSINEKLSKLVEIKAKR